MFAPDRLLRLYAKWLPRTAVIVRFARFNRAAQGFHS